MPLLEQEPIVKSKNFEFLRARYPHLADYGGYAETYVHADPPSALVKLRNLIEQLVVAFYVAKRLPRPYGSPDLNDLLNEDAFKSAVPMVALDKFHFVRIKGNKAAHGETFASLVALQALREAKDLADWFHVSMGGKAADLAPFAQPAGPAMPQTDKERAAATKKLAEQELRMAELIASIESERQKREALEQQQKLTAGELEDLRAKGQAIADALKFDEARTRTTLIDEALADAGWTFDESDANTHRVAREIRVAPAATPSGVGYADYVL
ncbi:MAG: DUF4145 domain-containing protein, partial [Deltaproteobacteria bacterium]